MVETQGGIFLTGKTRDLFVLMGESIVLRTRLRLAWVEAPTGSGVYFKIGCHICRLIVLTFGQQASAATKIFSLRMRQYSSKDILKYCDLAANLMTPASLSSMDQSRESEGARQEYPTLFRQRRPARPLMRTFMRSWIVHF